VHPKPPCSRAEIRAAYNQLSIGTHALLGSLFKLFTSNQDSCPVIPTTIMGKNRLRIASSPDTAANLTLVDGHIVDQAHLQPAGQVGIFTAAGPVKAETFTAEIELPTGSFKTIVASSSIPKALPFQAVLGGNLLDNVTSTR
jgi:hypothetical protein